MHSHRTILTSLRHKHKELEEYIPDNEYMYKVDSVVRCQATQIPTLTYQLLMEDSDSDSNLNGSSGKTGKKISGKPPASPSSSKSSGKPSSSGGSGKLSGKPSVRGKSDKLSGKPPLSGNRQVVWEITS